MVGKIILLSGFIVTSIINSAQANPRKAPLKPHSSSDVQFLAQSLINISDITINSVDGVVEIILTTPEPQNPQSIQSIINDKILSIELIDTQLEGEARTFLNPSPDIALIEVIPQPNNTVLINVEGESALPQGEIIRISEGIKITARVSRDEISDITIQSPQTIDLIVTATRTEEDINRVPRSVTVIDREILDTQTTLSPASLTEILGKEVPAFAPPSPAGDDRGSLRGRSISYLIDGIPVSDNFARPQRMISLDALERIEVVRGSNAVFGADATGGTVNLIPRKPAEGEDSFSVEAGITFPAGGGGSFFNSDGFAYFSRLELAQDFPEVDYLLSLSLEREGSWFDAEGDRIFFARPRDEDRTINFLGQFGFDLDDQQRLQLTVNHYDIRRVENQFIADFEGSEANNKALGLRIGEQQFIETPPFFDRNTIVSLKYTNDNLWGSSLSAQGYYRNYSGLTAGLQDRRDSFGFINNVLLLDIEGGGTRLQIDTPLGEQANLLWGADYDYQRRQGFTDFIDENIFDESGGKVIQRKERRLTLPYSVGTLGLFGQLQWDIVDNVILSGGFRYSNFNVNVSDYTSWLRGFEIEGGNISFDDIVFNVGAVYQINNEINFFANFAQGFSLPNFNRLLSNPPENLQIDKGLELLQPVNVNNYELGIRGQWEKVNFSLAGFYSNSKLSDSIRTITTEEGFQVTELFRAPQREYGIEATLNWQPNDQWLVGTTLTWQNGELEEEGEYVTQSTYVISPLKWTAYIQHQTLPNWRNRLQILALAGRDPGFYDPARTDGYIVVDYISSIGLGEGTLNIGIENLFNNQYLTPVSQLNAAFDGFAERASASRGRTITATYRVKF